MPSVISVAIYGAICIGIYGAISGPLAPARNYAHISRESAQFADYAHP
jgi:hypothetical protein